MRQVSDGRLFRSVVVSCLAVLATASVWTSLLSLTYRIFSVELPAW